MLIEIYSFDGVRLLLRAMKVGAVAANTGKTGERSKTAQVARIPARHDVGSATVSPSFR
jgi:hypothetical protein